MASVKIATLIEKLAKEAGIKSDDPKLIEALSITATIDDSLANAIENNPNAITVENAKHHPDILRHFNAKIFNGMDAKIYALANENGLDAGAIAEIKAEKNSYDKLALLNKKLTDSITAKHKTPADKEDLMAEIENLNQQILAAKTENTAAVEKAKTDAEKEITEYALNTFFSNLPYAKDEIPLDVNVLTARTLVSKHLAEKNAFIKREGNELKIYNAENDVPFLENNKPISFSDLSKQLLANNKLLKVSGQASLKGTVKTPQQTIAGKQGPKMDKLIGEYDKQIAELSSIQ